MNNHPSSFAKSASPAQVAANQANSQRSTGPKTEVGKEASSANRTTHGFTGSFIVLPSEDKEQYKALFHRLTEEHQPATETEELLVLKLAQSHWLIQRALDYQSGSMQQDNFITVEKQLSLFMRYQAQQERVFNKALAELKRLQKERRDDEYGVFTAKIASQCYRQSMESSKAEILKIKEAEAKAKYAGREAAKAKSTPTPPITYKQIGFESQNAVPALSEQHQPAAA